MDKTSTTRAWTLVIGVLLILALGAFGLVWVIRETIQQTVQPVNDVTGGISTRVAQVLNPTPTVLPDPVTIIHGVRALARLETIQYSVEKVITAESGQGPFGFLFGDKLVFVAHGIVVAGVDMAKMRPEDLRVQNGVLYVGLPDPEIFIATLDNQKSYVYNRDTGVLTHGDVNLETTARQAAEQQITQAAEEDGILKLARQNAESYMYQFLRNLGYPEVIFDEGDGTLVTPPPAMGGGTPSAPSPLPATPLVITPAP